tara:strand:+ start:140 stop:568 length:429 start_codon:yes stop_codon:yes gene_type:complete
LDSLNKLDQIILTPLKKISVEGGDVFHAMKSLDNSYKGFGEAYFSFVKFKAIKAWKKHKKMQMNLIVPLGSVKFVFFDDTNKKFRVEIIGKENYSRLFVPQGVFFGFQGLNKFDNLILNISDISHDPNEVIKKSLDSINFDW